uniref:Serine/arginine-rich splicing factor RSZ21 n=1 Tax=Oryza glumipatula TaxID=40148 RepID=A0A0E0A618_9ORYZ
MSPRAQRPRPKPRAVSLHKPNPTYIISSHLFPVFSNSPSRDLAFSPTHHSTPLLSVRRRREVAMARVYVGNLDPRVTARELEDEFRVFGVLRSVWVARKPPGFAFIDFDDRRDAQDAIRDIDGKNGWRVELSRNASSGRGGRDRYGSSESKCYECGETGHFARECRLRIGSGGLGSGRRRSRSRSRSRSPRYRRSPSYGRRSYSPAGRSPRRRSVSPARARSYSRSPQYNRGRDESPAYDNGYRRSRSIGLHCLNDSADYGYQLYLRGCVLRSSFYVRPRLLHANVIQPH